MKTDECFEEMECVCGEWNSGKLNLQLSVAIDETHCIDVWGQGFHEDYLKHGLLKDFKVHIVALTGAATSTV
jgi:superfamily II DNA helicase RecQ